MNAWSVKVLIAGLCCVVFTGCAVTPQKISINSHIDRAEYDKAAIYQDVVPLQGKLSIDEAIARGLLFNLDHRVTMMEETLQNSQLTLSNYNMLPSLAANAGYNWRNSERASESISLQSRNRSVEPSFSEDKSLKIADLTFSWSILDFGMSYYQAKQQSDRVLAAAEKRRRVMNNLVMQIQTAFWKALTAQRVLPKVNRVLRDVRVALASSKQIEKEGLESPIAALEYRRSLLQTSTQLKKLKSDLTIAKSQLASLINIPTRQKFKLKAPKRTNLPRLTMKVPNLQNYGLIYRPELREEAYKERISRQNVDREILRLFPAVSIVTSLNYDSNSLLAFNNWEQVALKSTLNLINSLVKGPRAVKTAKMQVEIDKTRRMALTAAILAQISISASQYHQSKEGYHTAAQLSDIETRILKIASSEEQSNEGTKLDRIQRSVQAISAILNKDQAYTDARSAFSGLLVSIGLDMVPSDVQVDDLRQMTELIREERKIIQNGSLKKILAREIEANETLVVAHIPNN